MTLTISHALRLPILLIGFVAISSWVVGKLGFNETIDKGQEIAIRFLDETQNTNTVQAAPDADPTDQNGQSVFQTERETTADGIPLPRMNVILLDESDAPISGICVELHHNGSIIDSEFTVAPTGKARLDYPNHSEGVSLNLVIDPFNHQSGSNNNITTIPFITGHDANGATYCFKRTGPVSGFNVSPKFELMANCPEATAQGALDEDVQNPSSGNIVPEELIPPSIFFHETFDENLVGWEEWDGTTGGGELRGNNYFMDGGYHMNLLASADQIIHRTPVPLEKELKNFGLFLEFSSLVQPQTADGVARLHIQFRIQPDGSYYNLSIDHTNVVTLYYIRPEDEPVTLDEFHSDYYLTEAGATNSLNLEMDGDTIKVSINNFEERTYQDRLRYADQAGGISFAVDSSAGNVVSYKLSDLIINEWADS